jgi:hypothetical protein
MSEREGEEELADDLRSRRGGSRDGEEGGTECQGECFE